MSIHLTLICQGASAATRGAMFPADEGLDAAGLRAAQMRAGTLRRVGAVWAGPGRAARETVAALGLDAREAAGLTDIEYGRWAGRRMDEVSAADPAGFALWLADPAAAPHGGSSIAECVARMVAWMTALEDGRVLAVVPGSLARAAVVVALGAPASAFWRVDVAPLGRVVLSGRGLMWKLQSLGRLEETLQPNPLPDGEGRA
ncbi:MAG: histidine phosphatase family protein [Pseudomonadota bacterium]|nr:histidine phosphatase family protein [Pseudomonadota bacterium]